MDQFTMEELELLDDVVCHRFNRLQTLIDRKEGLITRNRIIQNELGNLYTKIQQMKEEL